MGLTSVEEIVKREGFYIDEKGLLLFDGCDLMNIADKYGTPCYVYSESIIRQHCEEYIQSFQRNNIDYEIIYAGKAFLVKALCKILNEEGFGIDVSSGGEAYTVLSAGFPAERIFFHGNNKSEGEIKFAIENNIGTIMIDNLYELNLVNRLAKEFNKQINIMIRVIPGVDTHTHEKIRTGQVDSKFGIPILELVKIIPVVLEKDNLVLKGLHCHIGSQLLDVQYHLLAVDEMIQLIQRIQEQCQIKTEYLNIGGGLGVKYTDADSPVSISDFVNNIIERVKNGCQKYHLPIPKIMVEPGRSIVAEAGITLYRIGAIKKIKGLKKYLIVDGGMADNPRPSLYDARYDAFIFNKFSQNPIEEVTVAGKYCESGDILIKNIQLPKAESGDLIVFFSTGAYHYAMSSNYNGIPRPPVVLVNQGKHELIVKGETYQDIVHNQVLPPWLEP